jgi:hypothetical protein
MRESKDGGHTPSGGPGENGEDAVERLNVEAERGEPERRSPGIACPGCCAE